LRWKAFIHILSWSNCCIFFSDKWNHIECLCNISLFRLEFQCGNWLKLIKSWHKTSANLFNFRIQIENILSTIVYCNQDSCSWILKHQSWNIVLTNSRANSVNSRAEIAYMLKSDLSRKISHDHTQADKDIHLQYLSNRSIRERVFMSISNAMQSELVMSSHNQRTWSRQRFRVFKTNRRNSTIATTLRQVERVSL